MGCDELIAHISTTDKPVNYKCLPYAMQPEAVCGFDADEIQRKIAKTKILSKLIDYNKTLGNSLLVHQQDNTMKECRCWLDYFLLSNVYSVGFGLDVVTGKYFSIVKDLVRH